jgi:hypothetical protein
VQRLKTYKKFHSVFQGNISKCIFELALSLQELVFHFSKCSPFIIIIIIIYLFLFYHFPPLIPGVYHGKKMDIKKIKIKLYILMSGNALEEGHP